MVRKIRNEVGGLAVALATAFVAMGAGTAVAVDLDQVVAQRMEVNDDGAKSQVRIDKLSDHTDRLLAEYRVVIQRIDTSEWFDFINPGGFSGDSCYTGGCGRSFAENGCGGMSSSRVVF